MDVCNNCTVRGNLEGCMKTPCIHHQSWFSGQLLDMLREARDTIDSLGSYHAGAELCERIDDICGENEARA
jgi:hypothetical protein